MKRITGSIVGLSFLLGVAVSPGLAQMKKEREKEPGAFPKEQHTIHVNKEQEKIKELQKEVDTLKSQQKGSGAVAAPPAAEKAAVSAPPATDTQPADKKSKKTKKEKTKKEKTKKDKTN